MIVLQTSRECVCVCNRSVKIRFGLVKTYVHYAHQAREMYHVLSYAMDFKAPWE